MNELINGNAIKMTSIEIAELVGKRHDNVKRTIETLAKNGVIRLPQIEVSERINNLGFNVQYEHYVFEGEQGKRDSIVVVAQLSPEFTARLVDRWRELEEAAVNIPKTLPEALRLAADLAEQKMQLENQLAIAAPKVEFADRVGEASGILIGNFAKVVGIGPNKLFAWMRDHKILIAFRIKVIADVPDSRRRDLDNILKGLLDSLIHAGFAEDDEQFDDIRVIRGVKVPGGRLGIKITELENV